MPKTEQARAPQEKGKGSCVVKKWAVRILRPIAGALVAFALFRGLMQPAGELCAIAIRHRWPDAWFSSSIVLNADFIALTFSIVIAVVVIQYASNRYLNSTEALPSKDAKSPAKGAKKA